MKNFADSGFAIGIDIDADHIFDGGLPAVIVAEVLPSGTVLFRLFPGVEYESLGVGFTQFVMSDLPVCFRGHRRDFSDVDEVRVGFHDKAVSGGMARTAFRFDRSGDRQFDVLFPEAFQLRIEFDSVTTGNFTPHKACAGEDHIVKIRRG